MLRPFFHGFLKILGYHLLFVVGLGAVALGGIIYSDNLITAGVMVFLAGISLIGILQLFYLLPLYLHALFKQRETAFRMGILAASLFPLGWSAHQLVRFFD